MFNALKVHGTDNHVVRRALGHKVAGDVGAAASVDDLMGLLRHYAPRGLWFSVTRGAHESADSVSWFQTLIAALVDADLGDIADVFVPFGALPADDELASAQVLARCGANAGVGVTFGVADPGSFDRQIGVVDELRRDFPTVALSLDVRDVRTEQVCRRLADMPARVQLTTLRGNGTGRHEIGHPSDLAYVRCLRILMEGRAYPMIASHDSRIVSIAATLASNTGRTPDDYEYQMLSGVRPWEQQRLVDIGRHVRVVISHDG